MSHQRLAAGLWQLDATCTLQVMLQRAHSDLDAAQVLRPQAAFSLGACTHSSQQHLSSRDAPGQAVPDEAVGAALQGQHLQQLLHAVPLVLQGLLHRRLPSAQPGKSSKYLQVVAGQGMTAQRLARSCLQVHMQQRLRPAGVQRTEVGHFSSAV